MISPDYHSSVSCGLHPVNCAQFGSCYGPACGAVNISCSEQILNPPSETSPSPSPSPVPGVIPPADGAFIISELDAYDVFSDVSLLNTPLCKRNQ